MKTSRQIRQDFIDFFKKHGHTFVPSSPVVPHEDPTLLFTNAGMNQFKDVFLETGIRPYNRAANSQKCIRVSGKHNDLEEVGHDTYHHTYFEMLGNWSFGDYFKKEAIRWAWELLTEVWGIPKERLYATVFGGDAEDGLEPDEEAEKLWKEVTDIDPAHVRRFGKKDNFWEMGDTGPCGPCSEIHIDLTADLSGGDLVNAGDPRVMEIWNLVFIQFNRQADGKLQPLPAKHVDTGMGFERVVRVLQNVESNYDTDIFLPILEHIGRIAGKPYREASAEQQVAFRVIADHIRMLTFSISDGGLPSNEGRGYVIRRILRRAARYARKLNLHEPFIYQLTPTVVAINGEAFPEIVEKQSYVMEVIKAEEENFNKTLDRGLEIFGDIVKRIKGEGKRSIPGEEAFRLYDTFGFPLDLTRIMAQEQELSVDEAGFEAEMEKQRERARKAGKFTLAAVSSDDWEVLTPAEETKFVGYENTSIVTRIHKIARRNGNYHLVLAETPFYAEAGGQVGDRGRIVGEGFELEVVDTQKEGGHNVSICVSRGPLEISNPEVHALVDMERRTPTTYNHTATHLLHAALRKVLGEHVRQAGSLVAPDHLRFDFTHFKKVEKEQLEEIERIVNERIQSDFAVEYYYTDFDAARKKGAMALFGEKYGDVVRVVSIAPSPKDSPVSLELCGGCHVKHTGQIGPFIITQESSIASGVRRIEALTGPKAVEYIQHSRNLLRDLDQLLNSPAEGLAPRLKEILDQARSLEKQLQQLKAQQVLQQGDEFLRKAEKFGQISLVIGEFQDADLEVLKQLGDTLRHRSPYTVGFLVNRAENGGVVNFVCTVTDDLIKEKKLDAGSLVKQAAQIAGGGGGGRPHLATAGAKNAEKLPEVLEFVRKKLAGL
ncbi:MAG: alanine--tRNA ligase [Calditrichaceae bacterium]|nr:alanine--tRNA ligase [Calditrichia bacterium]NUQ40413.1 alanine--tRNA ligase [Calditrichaceae bacterium]